MSVPTPNPNDASSDKWRLFFEGMNLVLFSSKVTDFNIPDVSSMGTIGPSPDPFLMDVSGNRIDFGPVVFSFIVDENYANYRELFNWMMENAKRDQAITRSFTVELLNNRGNSQGVTLSFEHGRPITLGSFQLDTTGGTKQILCQVTLNFQIMDFI